MSPVSLRRDGALSRAVHRLRDAEPEEFRTLSVALLLIGMTVAGVAIWSALTAHRLANSPGHVNVSEAASIAVASGATLIVAVALLRRKLWVLRLATLGFGLVVPAFVPTAMMRVAVPQVLWIPTLMALAVTSLRWSLGVAAASLLSAAVVHAEALGSLTFSRAYVTCSVLLLLTATRLVQDRLLESQRAFTRRAEHHRAALEEQQSELLVAKNVFDGSGEAMLVADLNGVVVAANPSFSSLTGDEGYDVLGQRLEQLAAQPGAPAVYAALAGALEGQEGFEGETSERRRSGETYPVRLSIRAVRDATGRATHFVASFADLRQQKAADELRVRYQQSQHQVRVAEDTARLKTEFLASVSHELRAPMNAIVGLAYLAMRSGQLPAAQQEQVQKIHRSGKLLLGVLNDVLDLSHLEAGKLALHPVDFSIGGMVEDLHDLLGASASQKGLVFDLVVAPSVPSKLHGDVLRLQQIVANVVSNAIKFTEQGSVRVEVGCVERSDRSAVIRCEVRDTGVGIPADRIERVFEPFAQPGSSSPRLASSSGLGLAITKRLVEMMDGQVRVDSAPGRGTKVSFTVRLGVVQAPATVAAPKDQGRDPNSYGLAGLRVLLVEDLRLDRELAVDILRLAGVTVETAENGAEAIARLEAGLDVDAVLMDLQMPVMDGLTATRRLRASPLFARLPIVAMTARTAPGEREASLAAGMHDHLTKPIEPDLLYDRLARLCRGRGPVVIEVAAPTDEEPVIDLSKLSSMLRGDAAKLARFTARFVETTRETLGEMAAARGRRDLAVIGAQAHKLKSSALTAGAQRLGQICIELESSARSGDFARIESLVDEAQVVFERVVRKLEPART
jgi:two-component system sensor histidine kinase/response regulator